MSLRGSSSNGGITSAFPVAVGVDPEDSAVTQGKNNVEGSASRPSKPVSEPGRGRFVQVGLCFLCTWTSYVERQGFSIAYTALAKRVGTPESVKGVVLSAFYYGYAASQVPGGWASARYGGWWVLQIAHVVWGVCSALTPRAAGMGVFMLVFVRALVGLAQGLVIPAIHTVLSQWVAADEKARAVSFTTSGLYLGSATAMAAFPRVVSSSFGPESIPIISAVMAFTWVLLTVIFAREPTGEAVGLVQHASPAGPDGAPDSKARRARPPSWGTMLSKAAVWAIVTNNFTFHYAFYVVMNWLPTFISSGLGVELADLGALKIAPYILMFFVSNVGGVVGDHLVTKSGWDVGVVRKLVNTTGFAIATVALLLIPLMPSVTSSIVMTSIAVGGCAFARGGFSINHMDIGPKYAGVIMGISNCAGTISGVIGVSLSGVILDACGGATNMRGWTYVFGIPALLNVIGAVHFIVYARGDRIFT